MIQTPRETAFVTTRWTQVLSARGESPEARTALGALCEAYWMPVFRFMRREGRDEDSARELTQGFFAQLLAKNGIETVEPAKGRFRSYLLGSVKHFLADQRDRAQAAKRGGGQDLVPIDTSSSTTTCVQLPDPGSPAPDAYFDRQWALNVIDRALKSLADDFDAAGKSTQFEALKGWLVGDIENLSQAEAGRQLGLTEGAVKVAIHRLRKQFRELVKTELAHTVESPEQVREELNYLMEALSQ